MQVVDGVEFGNLVEINLNNQTAEGNIVTSLYKTQMYNTM
jgi:hypothetical protein